MPSDRKLPFCSLCHKLNGVCEYPTHSEKPGPKTGELTRQASSGPPRYVRETLITKLGTSSSLHGPRAKRRRLGDPPSSSRLRSGDEISVSAATQAASFDPARRNSAASSVGGSISLDDGNNTLEEGPGISSPPSGRPRSHVTSAPIFSRIMYPSHEAQTRPQSPSTVDTPPGHRDRASGITVQSICEALKISRVTYDML